MIVCIPGILIALKSTVNNDVDTIIKLERSNAPFVHEYSKEKHLDLINDPDCLHLSVFRLSDNRLVGHTVSFGRLSQHKDLEFRRIAIAEKGKGYGRECIQLLIKYCFEKLKFHRMWLDVYAKNQRAIQLYESEGFVYEGTLRDKYLEDDGYHSLRLYSMLEKEYYMK